MPARDDRSLEQASADSHQELRALNEWVVRELDLETQVCIEVNGFLVANLSCLDQALTELGAGWAFLHHFCDDPADFHRATFNDTHVSVMVRGGIDIERRLGIERGEIAGRISVPDPFPRDEEWIVFEDVLLDLLREAFRAMRGDRATEGYIHAALASDAAIEVIAADLTPELAVSKVLGWALISGKLPTHEILVVNGAITRVMVDAAARLGVQLIATPFAPTADAWRMARVLGVSLVGYARNRVVAVFHNAEMIMRDDAAET